MATIHLVRHASVDGTGTTIWGRTPGIHLNEKGRQEAARIAEHFADVPIAAIYSSPLDRATETLSPLAEKLALEIITLPQLNEIDFGEWTGMDVSALDRLPAWRIFHRNRMATRLPGGESLMEVQARAISALELIRIAHPEQTVAVVTHGDPARAALCAYLGVTVDLLDRITIEPASISTLVLHESARTVVSINNVCHLSHKR